MRRAGITKNIVIAIALTAVAALMLRAGCQKTTDDAERIYRAHKPVFDEIVEVMRKHPELVRVDSPEDYTYQHLDMEFHQVYQGKYPSFQAEYEALRPTYMRVWDLAKSVDAENVQALTERPPLFVSFFIGGPGLFDLGERRGLTELYYDEDPKGLHTLKRSDGKPKCRPLADRFWYVCRSEP
jgi:hypothetical protein